MASFITAIENAINTLVDARVATLNSVLEEQVAARVAALELRSQIAHGITTACFYITLEERLSMSVNGNGNAANEAGYAALAAFDPTFLKVIGDHLSTNDTFYKGVAQHIDPQGIVDHLDLSDIVSEVDTDEIVERVADNIDASEVAGYINLDRLSNYIDTDSIAEKAAENVEIDYSDLASEIDYSDLAHYIDASEITLEVSDVANEMFDEVVDAVMGTITARLVPQAANASVPTAA